MLASKCQSVFLLGDKSVFLLGGVTDVEMHLLVDHASQSTEGSAATPPMRATASAIHGLLWQRQLSAGPERARGRGGGAHRAARRPRIHKTSGHSLKKNRHEHAHGLWLAEPLGGGPPFPPLSNMLARGCWLAACEPIDGLSAMPRRQ